MKMFYVSIIPIIKLENFHITVYAIVLTAATDIVGETIK